MGRIKTTLFDILCILYIPVRLIRFFLPRIFHFPRLTAEAPSSLNNF